MATDKELETQEASIAKARKLMEESRTAEQAGDNKLAEKLSDDAAFTAEMTPIEHNDENPFSKTDEPLLHRQFKKGSDGLFFMSEREKPFEKSDRIPFTVSEDELQNAYNLASQDEQEALDGLDYRRSDVRENGDVIHMFYDKEGLDSSSIHATSEEAKHLREEQAAFSDAKLQASKEMPPEEFNEKKWIETKGAFLEQENDIDVKEAENIKSDEVSEQIREQMKGDPSITPEDTKSELLADQAAQGKEEEEEERLRKKLEAETILAMTADAARANDSPERSSEKDNSLNVIPKGGELDRKDLVLPVAIERDFDEHEGKFFAKKTNRLMFEDKGDMIKTSTTDAKAIEAIVAYTKAKQWDSLKLSGSKEFRREVWLQAESQGIKTQGYTPKEADLAALSSLTNERATNTVTPLEPSKEKVKDEAKAPRHDLNKNQAVLHDEATKNLTVNIQALNGSLDSTEISADEVSRLAYWRGVIIEENKHEPQGKRDEVLAKFDDMAKDPAFIDSLEGKPREVVEEKYSERVQSHDEENEHSL